MSYEERNIWVFLVVAVTFYTAYVVVVLSRASGPMIRPPPPPDRWSVPCGASARR